MPAGKVIHAILDNYATHKHPAVMKWLADHPRWTFHFTPTSASWLNAVEGFFSTITRRKIRRGVFKSVPELEAEIARYIRQHNKSAEPFVWTKPAKLRSAFYRAQIASRGKSSCACATTMTIEIRTV